MRAGRVTEMILSSALVQGETEALGCYLVCPRSQSWFVAALGQEPNSSPFQPVFWHEHSAAFVLTCSFNFSLNLIFPLPIPNQIFASNRIVRPLAAELFKQMIPLPKPLGKQRVPRSFTTRKMCSFRGGLTLLPRGSHIMKGSFITSLYKRQR